MLKWLETFKVVYETKSFSKASELLFISQPTVSAQIKQLENEFDAVLFIRNGRKEVVATPQATLLYKKAISLIDEWESLYQEIKTNPEQSIRCKIGASHTFANYLLPKLLPLLHEKFPTLQFSVEMMNSMGVLHAIENHTIDIGFIEKPLSSSEVKRYSLMEDQLVLAGDTAKGPWLIRENTSGVYYYTKRFLEERDIKSPVMEIKSNEVIVSLLRQGFGCSVISKRAAQGIDYQLLDEGFKRHFFMIKRKQELAGEIERCITMIEKWGSQ